MTEFNTNQLNKSHIGHIGIVGMPLSGKDVAGKYLSEKYDYNLVNMHSPIIEEINKRKIGSTRDNFQKIGREWRKTEGFDVLAKKIAEDWIPYLEINIDRAFEVAGKEVNWENLKYVIVGIRNYEEVIYFREKYKDDFSLIAILAPQKIRYNRTFDRKREGFDTNISFEKFNEQDIFELSVLKLGSSIAISDYYILNIDTKLELFNKLDIIIESLKNIKLN